MRTLKASLLFSTILLLSFLAVVFAQKTTNHSTPKHQLAVEIGLTTPLTFNANTEGRSLKAFWRLPANANANGESPSAIKLEPKMVGDKMEVTVTVLSGDASLVKTCKDLGLLKESRVTAYTLTEGEEVTVSDLSNLGPNFKNGKLTFRAVPVVPQFGRLSEPCCASCGGNTCCPGSGNCLSCGGCGQLCC
jgi:hypothetical protein